jgi:hypothetical protein
MLSPGLWSAAAKAKPISIAVIVVHESLKLLIEAAGPAATRFRRMR